MALEATAVQPVIPAIDPGPATNPTEAQVRELAKAALAEGRVDVVIGWMHGYDRSQVVPGFATTPEDADRLLVNPLSTSNLTVYLKRKLVDDPGARIGIVVKGCDARTLIALLQEELVDREKLYVIGVGCLGTIDRRDLERRFDPEEVVDVTWEADSLTATTRRGTTATVPLAELLQDQCQVCRTPNAPYADVMAGPEAAPLYQGEPVWPGIEEFEALSPAEKDATLEQVFETCIRCFACIHACPVCWCWDQCSARARRPALVGQKVRAKENLVFQTLHMFHVAGRCPSCGNCDRACPVNIPLYLLHRKMNKELYDMLGFEAGMNLDEKPAFQTFKVDEVLGEQH